MYTGSTEKHPQFYAKVIGFGLLLMALLAIFANFFVIESFIIPGDAAATVTNLTDNELLFRLAIASFVIILVLDVIISWALYILLKRVNKSFALLAALFRLTYTAIFTAAIFNFLSVLELLNEESYSALLETNQLQAQVMLLIDAFRNGWLIGLVFFGVHLLLIGYLVFKSGFMPKLLGILVMLAGLGYLIDSFAKIILSNYSDFETMFILIVAIPGAIGELALAIWLLVKGKKIPEIKS
ncbi:hypothetical protein QOZ98_000236 [Planomicrobium stackebrandtii]|uniref:DUF4386 domain-containing protein n=1 Tax=Planomicrobium stackebrandtii TaxID=253160 RepID=A0ABU0GPX3_9BACL|nr:DUF4386 domain-containing protein [Planomicrobium stackebrandtii]MDQ0427411.1 hypothetical protein [Planomicrobium stackebrandtii]